MTTKSMTPSKKRIEGQIDKAVANYRALLEEHSGSFKAKDVQTVLGQPKLACEQLKVFLQLVELESNQIVFSISVVNSIFPQDVLGASGRVQHVDREVVDKFTPDGIYHGKIEVVLFKPDLSERHKQIFDDELSNEYLLRDLSPADFYVVAALNAKNPHLANKKPNYSHWRNIRGEWCFAAYCSGHVYLKYRDRMSLDDRWWFVGVRPSSKA